MALFLDDYENIDAYFQTINGANRFMSTTYSKAGIIESITYPTGGRTEFEFEPHEFENKLYVSAEVFNQVPSNPSIVNSAQPIGGGLRIKKITNKQSGGELISTRSYQYINEDSTSSGIHLSAVYNYKQEIYVGALEGALVEGCSCRPLTNLVTGTKHWLSGNSLEPLADYYIGTNVGYSQVEVINGTLTANEGKEVKIFLNDLPTTIQNKSFFRGYNGDLKEYKIYDKIGNLIKKEVFTYNKTDLNDQLLNATIHNCYFGASSGICYNDFECGTVTLIDVERNKILAYKNINFFKFLSSKIVTEYFSGDSVSTSYTYIFSPTNYTLTREQVSTSTSDLLKTEYKYPSDLSGTYASMSSANILSIPIEITGYRNNGVIKSILNTYKTSGGIFVPEMKYIVETTSPITNFTPFNGTVKDSSYNTIPEISFDSYDTKGNVIQYTAQNGIKSSFLWDASQTYIMAKIVGAQYSSVSSQNGKICTYNSKNLWNTLTGLATNALITTYSHDPLDGLKQSTDYKGTATYYTYDTFGRLAEIRDDDNRLLKKYVYNYATTTP
jgi:YD repeat-containing protein